MESGEGENLEKWSTCLGTLARAAFFMIYLTNFIVVAFGGGPGSREGFRRFATRLANDQQGSASDRGRGTNPSQWGGGDFLIYLQW